MSEAVRILQYSGTKNSVLVPYLKLNYFVFTSLNFLKYSIAVLHLNLNAPYIST